jgi:hypothetical protein
MFLYFLRGSLPWGGIRAYSRWENNWLVFERKQTISVAELCDGVPPEFATYMDYVYGLSGRDQPHYRYLSGIFNGLFHHEQFEHDNVFDWTIREFERLHPTATQHLVPAVISVVGNTSHDRPGSRSRKRGVGYELRQGHDSEDPC